MAIVKKHIITTILLRKTLYMAGIVLITPPFKTRYIVEISMEITFKKGLRLTTLGATSNHIGTVVVPDHACNNSIPWTTLPNNSAHLPSLFNCIQNGNLLLGPTGGFGTPTTTATTQTILLYNPSVPAVQGNLALFAQNSTSFTVGIKGIAGHVEISSVKMIVSYKSPPIPDFSASATTIQAGQSINFTDQSLVTPTSWQWMFQGGTPPTSPSQNPTNIVYNTPGSYDVSLQATNINGSATKLKSNYITVVPPLSANAGNNKEICQGGSTSIGGAIPATGGIGNYTYSWSPATGLGSPSNATLANPVVSPSSTTTYTLTVKDAAGNTSTDNVVVDG